MKLSILHLLFISICLSACSSFFYYPNQDQYIDPAKLPLKPEDIFFETKDGGKLHGWYFRHYQNPKKIGKKAIAKILFFHGNAQNISTHFSQLYFLLHYNIDYFIFDYRGYGLSPGEPSPRATTDDGIAAINWILDQDPETPLIVFGQSLGGAIAAKSLIEFKKGDSASKLEKSLRLIVIDSSFSDYKRVAADTLSKNWVTWLFQPLAWLIVDNSQAPESALGQLGPTPILVVHGTDDPVVRFSMGQRFLDHCAEPKMLASISGGRHTDFLFKEGGKNRKPFVSVIEEVIECGLCFGESVKQIN